MQDFQTAFAECKRDKNKLLSLLWDEFRLSFNGNECEQNKSIFLFELNSIWWVNEFGFNSPILNAGNGKGFDFEGIIYNLVKGLDNKERAAKTNDYLNRYINTDFQTPTPATKAPTPTKYPSPKAQKLEVQFCSWVHESGKATKDYFQSKAGVTIETLENYEVKPLKSKSWGKAFYYTYKDFGFAYEVGENLRIKQPNNPDKAKIYDYDKGTNPYIFGLAQLPLQGEKLVFCAGETDALCINEHCKGLGIYAICLMNETDQRTITNDIASDLQARFKQVFVLYDADKAGFEFSRKLAQKWGFVWCNPYLLVGNDYNDICDIYSDKDFGGAGVASILDIATNLHTRINTVPNDIYSLDVPFAYKVDFNQYLSENNSLDTIKSLLKYESKLALQSPAGTGKSTMIQALCKPEKNGENFVKNSLGLNKTIVAVPTTAIALQLHTDFGGECGIMYGAIKGVDLDINREKNLVICTYDALVKMQEFIPNSLFIVDEFHQLVNDMDYRDKGKSIEKGDVVPCLQTWYALQSSPRSLLLSATPNYFFSSFIAPFFNFPLVLCYPKVTNTIKLKVLSQIGTKKDFVHYVEEYKPAKKGTVCLKLDNNSHLRVYKKRFEGMGQTCAHITSSATLGTKKKEETSEYPSIMKNGTLPCSLNWLLYTSVFEAGVSFKFPVPLVAISDVKSWAKIVQLATRPRLCTDSTGETINKEIDVWVLWKDAENIGYANEIKRTAKERWGRIYKQVVIHSNRLNGLHTGGENTVKLATDIQNFTEFNGGKYTPNILAILHEIFKQETAQTSPKILCERIERFDKRFICSWGVEVECNENADTNADFEQTKEEKKECKELLYKLFENSPVETISHIIHSSKNTEFKEQAKAVFGALQGNVHLKEFAATNKKAFKGNEGIRLIKDIIFAATEQGVPLQLCAIGETPANHEAIQKVIFADKRDLDREQEIFKYEKRKAQNKQAPSEQDAKDKYQIERDLQVLKRFDKLRDNIKQGKIPNSFTSTDLLRITNAAIKGNFLKGYTQTTVIKYLSILYDLERTRKQTIKGKEYIYTILGRRK